MQDQPALGDRVIEAGLIFRRRPLQLVEKGRVDLLDIDPAILDRLESVGEFEQLACRGLGSAKGLFSTNFIAASFPNFCPLPGQTADLIGLINI